MKIRAGVSGMLAAHSTVPISARPNLLGRQLFREPPDPAGAEFGRAAAWPAVWRDGRSGLARRLAVAALPDPSPPLSSVATGGRGTRNVLRQVAHLTCFPANSGFRKYVAPHLQVTSIVMALFAGLCRSLANSSVDHATACHNAPRSFARCNRWSRSFTKNGLTVTIADARQTISGDSGLRLCFTPISNIHHASGDPLFPSG